MYKNSIWFRWPVLPEHDTLWGDLLKPPTHIDLNINNDDFINFGKKTNLKIFKDKNNFYSKKILARLIKFCKKNFNVVYLSSWNKEVHEYLKTHFIEYLLPVFDYSGPKAKDNVHPTIYQYNKFVESIHEKL